MLTGMSEPPRHRPTDDDDREDDDRAAIVARRNRFVAAALVGIAGATLAAACSDGTTANDAGVDASATGTTTSPQPCLSVAVDAEPPIDAGEDASDANDAAPQPCLVPPLDSGNDQ